VLNGTEGGGDQCKAERGVSRGGGRKGKWARIDRIQAAVRRLEKSIDLF